MLGDGNGLTDAKWARTSSNQQTVERRRELIRVDIDLKKTSNYKDFRLAVAPMMDWTDKP